MLAEERRTRLLELVRKHGFASLPQLAGELAVSESTVRRDLDQLEKAGTAKRTHGGVFYSGQTPGLPHFEERTPHQWDKKRIIADRAIELISDGETIFFDGGSTTYEVARRLVGRRLQVVTNSLPVANLFAADPNADLVLVGGYVYPRTGVALGPMANDMLSQIRVHKTVMSVGGVDSQGLYNSNLLLVETERAMMKAADEVVVVADSTKFGHPNLAFLCPLNSVHRMVVDSGISQDWRSRLIASGVKLTVAGLDPSSEP